MTTITREQLHERARRKVKELEFAITQSAFTSIRDGLNEELDLARIALASLEAEPIGAFHIEDQQVSGTTDYIKDGEWPIDNGVIEVYAVPPAPVVPEEMPKGLAGQIVSLLVHNIGDKFLAQKIWNACHAALLQGSQPVSNCDELQVIGWLRSDYNSDDKRDPNAPLFMLGRNDPSDAWGVKYIQLSGNSPVSPGGWISCSERMPDDGQHVIILCDGAFVLYAQYRDGEFFDVVRNGEGFFETHSRNVTDWMPLPEPPQEEK